MSEFELHTVDTAPEGSKPWLEKAQAGFGFVPNLIAKLGTSPVAVEAYLTLHGIFGKSTLTPAEQQVVTLAINFENECHYCMAAHTGAARRAKLDEAAIGALRAGEPIPDPKLQALREFAVKVVRDRGWVDAADQQALLDAGYTRENILEVVVGAAFKTISNYSNHIVETPLDDAFAPLKWEKPSGRAA